MVEHDFITDQVRKKIIAVKDITYTDEFGLQELVDRSQDVLAEQEIAGEKKIMTKFLEMLATKEELTTYGEVQTRKGLEMGAMDTLLLSESLTDEKIDEFEAIAKKYSTTVQIISTETREGVC